MFKIAICDDDRNYWRVVKETVSRYSSNIKGIAFYEYSSGEELLADTHQIHIVNDVNSFCLTLGKRA